LPAARAFTDTVMGIAGGIFRPVDRGLQQIRRVGAAIGIPADVELYRGDGAVGIGRLDVEPIAAGRRLEAQPHRLVGRKTDVTIGNAAVDLPARNSRTRSAGTTDSAVPASTARSAARRAAIAAVGSNEHHVEIGLVTLGDALVAKQRLTPISEAAGATGSTILRSTERPPVSTMRMKIWASCGRVELGGFSSFTGKPAAPLASASGRFSIGVRSFARGFLVGDAELVAGIAGPPEALGATSMSPSSCSRRPARRKGNAR